MGTLRVRNLAQKVLWEEELSGQISDGAWENATPYDHWEYWHKNVQVVIDPEHVGRDFYVRRDSYGFNRKDLLDIIGDRMIEYVREATGDQSYDMKQMRKDLADLGRIIKIRVPSTMTIPVQPESWIKTTKHSSYDTNLTVYTPKPDSLNYDEPCDSCAAEAGELCLPSCEGNGNDAPERTFTMADFDTAAKS